MPIVPTKSVSSGALWSVLQVKIVAIVQPSHCALCALFQTPGQACRLEQRSAKRRLSTWYMALLQAIEMLFGRRAMLHCCNASWRPEIAGMACSKGAKVDQAKAGAWVIGYVDIIARYHMNCCFSLKLVPLTP